MGGWGWQVCREGGREREESLAVVDMLIPKSYHLSPEGQGDEGSHCHAQSGGREGEELKPLHSCGEDIGHMTKSCD